MPEKQTSDFDGRNDCWEAVVVEALKGLIPDQEAKIKRLDKRIAEIDKLRQSASCKDAARLLEERKNVQADRKETHSSYCKNTVILDQARQLLSRCT